MNEKTKKPMLQGEIAFKKIKASDHRAIFGVMQSMKKWFNEDALKSILIDLKFQKGYLAEVDSEVIGFVTYFTYDRVGNIGWLGVKEKFQNRKIGRRFLELIERDFIAYGIHTMQVWTLSDSVAYEPYEKTRQFYYRNGFKEFRRVKTDNPGCPEELYLRKSI